MKPDIFNRNATGGRAEPDRSWLSPRDGLIVAPIKVENIVATNTVLIACAKEKDVTPTMMPPTSQSGRSCTAAEGAAKK